MEIKADRITPANWRVGWTLKDDRDVQWEIVDHEAPWVSLRGLPEDERIKPHLVQGLILPEA